MAKQEQNDTIHINIQEYTTHVIESEGGLLHKGQPVRLTGKVAMEVEDVKTGRKAWVRHLDVVLPPVPHEPKRTAAKSAPRIRKAAAKTS